ncbi:hypothetical protein [Streptomyces sp. NPDC000983]|uniref:hypothetical protein n=1 Tax=Streptomyces sp. NPDC000983 TaxID=3154373 RepID=UPI003332F354
MISQSYADFLHRTAHALHLCTTARFTREEDSGRPLREAVDDVRGTLDAVRQRLHEAAPDGPDDLATYGTLLSQARRLTDRLDHSSRA